jgi:phage terminase large subunit
VSVIQADFPEWAAELFQPHRYKAVYGGRGASRSWSFARALLIQGAARKLFILCTREFQSSIQDSVHKLLSEQIHLLNLPGYIIEKHLIRHVVTGTEFVFEGIRFNINKIKSMEGIDVCWVEEAESISEESWQVLIPTIRKPGSEIWVSFNPYLEEDPTSQRFIMSPPPSAWTKEVNWRDNPWFPDVLREEMEFAYSVDAEAAEWVWGGKFRKGSQAAVFAGKWRVDRMQPDPKDARWIGPLFGADFGFGNDPATVVKVWIYRTSNLAQTLYIEKESYRHKLDLHRMPDQWNRDVPGTFRHLIRADSARPESISYLKQHGMPRIVSTLKWPGSIEDGVAYIRNFVEVVINPECIHTKDEFRLYSYKTDKQTGAILPVILDKHNHLIDPIRYALSPLIRLAKQKKTTFSGMSG